MKINKKILFIILIIFTLILALILILEKSKPTNKTSIRIGISTYKSNDTFINDITKSIESSAKEFEKETGIQVTLDISSAKGSQRTQNEQIKRYISLNYDVICVNLVDRTDATSIIDSAISENIPIVFFNREPVDEDIFRGENIYYVGTDPRSTAILQSQILIDAYIADKEKIDKNNDGILQYVLLEGEMGHQDTIIRSELSISKLTQYGIKMEKLQNGTANWERSQAKALMLQWLEVHGDNIEVVICNNDDMALGASDAVEEMEIGNITILGIDATSDGIQAVKDGKLLGTIDCNCHEQGNSIFKLASSLALFSAPPDDMSFENDRYVKIIPKIFSH